MQTLTIFTPVYNRIEKISALYKGLCGQEDKDFVWLIVDDGSTDGTEAVVKTWMKEAVLCIHYLKQENGGKHRAHNRGVEICDTEWFFCIDSDDLPESNTVRIIKERLKGIEKEDIGIVFPRYPMVGVYEGPWFPDGTRIYIPEIKMCFHRVIETAIVFRTSCLKGHLFPEIDGENFMSEEVLHNGLMQEGSFVAYRDCVYRFAYLQDGLTSRVFQLWKENPRGSILLLTSRYNVIHRMNLPMGARWREKIGCIFNINALCMATNRRIRDFSPDIKLSVLLLLPSFFFKKRRFG